MSIQEITFGHCPHYLAGRRIDSMVFWGVPRVMEARQSFEGIAALPSNIRAIEAAYDFGTGNETLVLVVGPTGWGKSRLLQASADAAVSTQGAEAKVCDARAWASHRLNLNPDDPLWLDNFQDAMSQSRSRLPLRLALERRVRAKRPTMIAATGRSEREIEQMLPYWRNWKVVRIGAPSQPERQLVVSHLSGRMGLDLSPALQTIISKRLKGSARGIEGALRRLQLAGSTWTTDVETIRACGILVPLFDDNGEWDMRTTLQESAQKFLSRNQLQSLDERSLAIYSMRHWAQIPEADVAHFFEATGGQVYGTVRRYRERLRNGQVHAENVQKFAAYVVDRMSRDR